jgi:DNA polymerase-3 subunit alpha
VNISKICEKKLFDLGLHEDIRYKKRLDWEIKEIQAKEKESYFIDLFTRKVRYAFNQNNLLVCWLLGIVPDFDIDKNPNCVYGEFPDIDTDYLPSIRNYIKEVWAPKAFGEDYVCNIGNYTTFGIKSALIDMARVHGESKDEIHAITKNIEAKDEDGKVLTWDAAMRLYPELKKYCELDDNHRKIATAARKLLHRNRGMGVHAGGLIIANAPLFDLVPLVKRKDTPQASAWVEGLSGQDLGPVGLVKFDLLVIANLLQVARCCDMVKRRHSLDGICNKPGESDWTDIPAWRNDPLALSMANNGDLKCIFQFESDGMRAIVRSGGVDRFEDLVAYSSIFRPGPLGEKMQERYIERKKGREKYTLHPLVKPILEDTYGVMIFQEQTMKMLNVVGEIPLKDCELVRKAISKKKVEGFIKYKEMFVLNGQKNLGCSEDEINNIWNQLLSWSEYGFNKCLLGDTLVRNIITNDLITLEEAETSDVPISLLSFVDGEMIEDSVESVFKTGNKEVFEIILDNEMVIRCTMDHKFICSDYDFHTIEEILEKKLEILWDYDA